MRRVDGRLVYSATDLVGYLECAHLANIERAAVWGHLNRPVRADPVLDRIAQRGIEYEQRFLESLRGDGATVVEVERHESLAYDERRIRGRDETVAAMRDGVDVIYQAVLFDERRFGYADFLRRVEQPSDPWQVELRSLGHEARPPRDGVGGPAAVPLLGHGPGVAGTTARGDAPGPRAAIRAGMRRAFTQAVSRLVYECRSADGGQFTGIYYRSRLDDGVRFVPADRWGLPEVEVRLHQARVADQHVGTLLDPFRHPRLTALGRDRVGLHHRHPESVPEARRRRGDW